MSALPPDLNAVLRLSDVVLSRKALEAALEMQVYRFEGSCKGNTHYAQINLPKGASWDEVTAFAERIGPLVQTLFQQSQIGRPSLDVALHLEEGFLSASIHIPHAAVAAIGRFGINLEISAYLMTPD